MRQQVMASREGRGKPGDSKSFGAGTNGGASGRRNEEEGRRKKRRKEEWGRRKEEGGRRGEHQYWRNLKTFLGWNA
jgi:hypothetical protein